MKIPRSRWFAAACLLACGATHAFVLGPTHPGKWGPPDFGTGATITFSYMSTGVACSADQPGCTITELGLFGPAFGVWKSEIEAAFDAWSKVADVTITEVPDVGEAFNSDPLSGDIRIGGHAFPNGLAHGFFPPANGRSAAGDLHFDTSSCWESVFDGGADGCLSIFQVAAHKIGHILGLDASIDIGALMNRSYTESFRGPQDDGAAGVAFIYGPAASAPGGGGGGGGDGGGGGGGGGGTGVPEPLSLGLLVADVLAAGLTRWRQQADRA